MVNLGKTSKEVMMVIQAEDKGKSIRISPRYPLTMAQGPVVKSECSQVIYIVITHFLQKFLKIKCIRKYLSNKLTCGKILDLCTFAYILTWKR